jgi:hypothetical protein
VKARYTAWGECGENATVSEKVLAQQTCELLGVMFQRLRIEMNGELDSKSVMEDFAALRDEDRVYGCHFPFHATADTDIG